jgi:hypothetical protein
MSKFIVVYLPKDALRIETKYFGPFDDFIEAENFLGTLPAAIYCDCKFIEELSPPIPVAPHGWSVADTSVEVPAVAEGNRWASYAEFQRRMASYGFISTPITEEQFALCDKLSYDAVYGIACDVNAGLSFEVAVAVNTKWEAAQ